MKCPRLILVYCLTVAGLIVPIGGCAEVPTGSDGNAAGQPLAGIQAPPGDSAWRDISKALERTGAGNHGVYVVTVPRDDLEVSIDGMGIPTAAGIESIFYFYRCPCGKMNVAGRFVLADYEANDVLDELRKNAILKVASIGPLLLYDKPRLLVIHFQGEGDPAAMAKALREALRWTGKERMAPQPLDAGKVQD